ncbi:MAG: signal peptidase I [Methylibium sp.]|jgi:signal peptidase I|uniref:signal peptidase I n=1 Tax=unclassified Methylibium TaxID=2633235 RepID=UPI0006F5B637|nr:signal peptidase I [Methylibium sp. Root1272]KQW65793.1 S26 family signal peptidase [Methylibium sp. Root1272]MDP1790736.1 signal peptidase I [Methylibium sp.]
MSALTGLLYGALAVYLGGWYLGSWSGNFSLLLFILTLATFGYWLAERLHFLPRRVAAASALEAQDAQRRSELQRQGIQQVDGNVTVARERVLAQPWWLDWTAGLFPVILAVFLLRSFLFEPFKIPSGSMIPTLAIGDLILVNKFHYGVRLPVINKKILANNDPQRGDVMVFRYPVEPGVDYIKRVVGLPGDEVAYLNKKLSINGQPVETRPLPEFYDEDSLRYAQQASEKLGAVEHRILTDKDRPGFVIPMPQFQNFRDNCRYSAEGVVCTVPPGHYFMMGDNRDNSQDSRYWGFVPNENIVGKAFFVWMNFGNLKRIGSFH